VQQATSSGPANRDAGPALCSVPATGRLQCSPAPLAAWCPAATALTERDAAARLSSHHATDHWHCPGQ